MFDPQFLKSGLDQGDLGCLPLSQFAIMAGHSLKHVEHWVSKSVRPVSCVALKQEQRSGHRYFAHAVTGDFSLSFASLGNDVQAFSAGDDSLYLLILVNGMTMRCPTGSLVMGHEQDVLAILPNESYNSLLSAKAQKIVIRVDAMFLREHEYLLDVSHLPNQHQKLLSIQNLTFDLLNQLMVTSEFQQAQNLIDVWGVSLKKILLSATPMVSSSRSYSELPSYIQMFLGWVQVQACDSKMPDMLDLLPVSTRKFYADFQTYLGCSPYQYLKLHRLRRVRIAMLEDSGQNLSDLASIHGFSHLGRFSGYFKQVFGVLPSQLRNEDMNKAAIDSCETIARTSNLCWVAGDHRTPVKALDMRCQHCIRKLTA